ncbi:MAG: hypothetical protein QOH71_3908 [Blastocatellia bacterium]|nr:hypothetical protein [Blastocatellia bacterium]
MDQALDLYEVQAKMAKFITSGTLDQRVLKALMSADGFVPKECELWDYKTTANGDALSKAKTVMQILSFYNAYGGYILYGVIEDGSKEKYLAKGITANCVNQQQIGMLIKEYTGESIDFTYREVPVRHGGENLLFGILHVPKRPGNHPPVFFAKNGPDVKPHIPLFQKDHAYVRLQDNCIAAKDKKALQFLFGPRELEIDSSKDHKRSFAPRALILDHNLPDRDVICSRFFGRDEIIERLWLWLSDEFSTTRVLAGDGGRGKTSIAYEFCEEVCRARPFELSRIFWVTAKQKQFSGTLNDYRHMPETHFNDFESLLRALCLGYAMLETEVDDVALRHQRKSLQSALRLFPSLIIVDDIDSVEDLNEQKRILELCSAISAGTPSRFLLTTRMNLTASNDVCLRVPGLSEEEYRPYVDYLVEKLNGPIIGKKEFQALWKATDGSPLFTESVLRLLKQGTRLSKAIKQWNGKLGEEVRMAALEREIQKLSLEARRVLLTCAYMGGASIVEIKQVTGYDDARMTDCISQLTSLFLLRAPDFIKKVPRFEVPTNTARLVFEKQKDLVMDTEGLKKTIQNLRGRKITLQKIDRSSGAIAQMYALMREGRFDDAIKTIEAAVKQLGQNPELVMHCGKCYFEKARQKKDSAANTAARKLFRRSYELGQRKSLLFECWFRSEIEADNPGGAFEVAELAINNNIEPTTDWILKRANSLEKLARRHAQSHNPQEALVEFERSATDIVATLRGGCDSRFEQENLQAKLSRMNDERVNLVCRIARDFSGWEQAVETIVSIVDSGDVRRSHASAAVDAFIQMVQSMSVHSIKDEMRTRRHVQTAEDEEGPRKHHLAAIHNRRRDIRRVLQRTRFVKVDERAALETKIKMVVSSFESDPSKTAAA